MRLIAIAGILVCIFGTAKSNSRYDSKGIKDSIEIKIDTLIAHMGLSSTTPGGVVAAIKNGKIIFIKAYGLANFETKESNRTSTLFNLRSVSKQFTATRYLMLEKGKKLEEKFLLNKISSLKEKLPFDQALNMLLISNGMLTIEKTASIACQSLKQFERKCRDRIGMNPKMYARILKFSNAYRMHEASPNISWTQIAHKAGYFDQMHMIRDFKTFAGVNPSVIEQQLRSTPIPMQKYLRI